MRILKIARLLFLTPFVMFVTLACSGSDGTSSGTPLPEGPRIAFVSDRDGNSEIYVMNPDGTDIIRLTNTRANDDNPVWSPDGSKLAFVSDRDFNPFSMLREIPFDTAFALSNGAHGGNDIYIMEPNGANVERITTRNPDDDFFPSWSPDGSRIAFASDRESNTSDPAAPNSIYIMNADGSNAARISSGTTFSDFEPSWSPDGTRLAFTTNRDGNLEIYVMDTNGANLVRLTNNEDFDFQPKWSPDGSKIAFSSFRNGNLEIYSVNPDGSNVTRLTDDPGTDNDPAWSPNSSQIAFSSSRDGNLEIYVMNADGSNVTQITNDPDSDSKPSWRD